MCCNVKKLLKELQKTLLYIYFSACYLIFCASSSLLVKQCVVQYLVLLSWSAAILSLVLTTQRGLVITTFTQPQTIKSLLSRKVTATTHSELKC